MNSSNRILMVLGIIGTTVFGVLPNTLFSQVCDPTNPGYFQIDFEGIGEYGTIIGTDPLRGGNYQPYAGLGLTLQSSNPSSNPLTVFDSGNPTGGDVDLGTPSCDCPGPPTNCAGQSNNGGGGNNCSPLGNVLIIAEDIVDTLDNNSGLVVPGGDGRIDDPDDEFGGGTITITFDNPFNVQEIAFVDDAAGDITIYPNGGLPQTISYAVGLDNDTAVVNVNYLNVDRIDIGFVASGAISSITFCDLITGSVSDQLFEDIDGDGIYTAGTDIPLSNVTVTLTNSSGGMMSVQTNSQGEYLFDNLIDGTYTLTVDPNSLPSGLEPFVDLDGTNTPNTTTVTVSNGEDRTDVDFGYISPASIGDFVFEDNNANGLQDNGESGIGGVTVSLTDENGDPVTDVNGNTVMSTTTANDGSYSFDNLMPGDYIVVFTTPNGLVASPANVGADDAADSDANPINGQSPIVNLTSGENDPNIDAGFFAAASVGDTVFLDANANGIQDPGETGIPNVTVSLTDENGDPVTDVNGNTVMSTTTANDGSYSFDNLMPGDYIVVFTTPNGLVASPANVGADDAADSDANPINGQSPVVNLASGENDPTY